MHMANELLSVPVSIGTIAIAAGGISLICRKAKQIITSDKFALMGILGAFVFAGQMVNFQLPAMPGTSGHMVGAVLLSIILGPHLAAIVMSSVVITQCLIFQDGGLLAIGCNIINIAIVPSYVGYFLYRIITNGKPSVTRIYIGSVVACVIAIEAGAILVPLEVCLSGVLLVPLGTFLVTMVGVHFLVGIIEGIITVAVIGYIQQVRPDITVNSMPGKIRLNRKTVLATFVVFTLIIAMGLSLLASSYPDGLEWSYAERPDQPNFQPAVSNESPTVSWVEKFQSKYSPMPDYSRRTSSLGQTTDSDIEVAKGWTSFAGVVGSVITMLIIWLIAIMLRRKITNNGNKKCIMPT